MRCGAVGSGKEAVDPIHDFADPVSQTICLAERVDAGVATGCPQDGCELAVAVNPGVVHLYHEDVFEPGEQFIKAGGEGVKVSDMGGTGAEALVPQAVAGFANRALSRPPTQQEDFSIFLPVDLGKG